MLDTHVETVTRWELGLTSSISIENGPYVISFVDYYPFPPPTNLADRLKALRKCYGFTQSALCRALLTSDVHTLVRYEAGILPKRRYYLRWFNERVYQ